MNENIPLVDLRRQYHYMKKEIDQALFNCLNQQNWILGPEVTEIESQVARHLGVKYAIGVASGTDALLLSLRALAIKLKKREYFEKEDKIITTPFTFTATGDAILRAGATPLFVDIDPETLNIDMGKIKECLNSTFSSDVVGLIPVHLFGQACNMDGIIAIAREYNLFVVEDVAQAFGGAWKEIKLGSFGGTGALSFFPSKNLGGFGDGGMILTSDAQTAELVRMLLKHGGKDKYNVEHIGYNSRLDTIQAAILIARLNYVDEFNERRRRIADSYSKCLKDTRGIILPKSLNGAYHVYNQYTVRIPDNERDIMQKKLKERNISTAVYYPLPLHKMNVFEGRCCFGGELLEAERASAEVLSLPIEPLLKQEEINYVCNSIKELLAEK